MEAINEMIEPIATGIAIFSVLYMLRAFGVAWDQRTELLQEQHRELMSALERQGRVS